MDDANDVVTSNLQLKLRPFSTEEPAASDFERLQLRELQRDAAAADFNIISLKQN